MATKIPILSNYSKDPTPLSQGMYGSIYKGYNKMDQKCVIIKECIKYHEYVMREVNILTKTNHNNIIKLVDWDCVDKTLWMVFDYNNEGELLDFCKKNKPNLKFTVDVVQQCAEGLNYLHTLATPIVHRNVHPRNILLHTEKGVLYARLCNFELSKMNDTEVSLDDIGLDIYSLGLVLKSMYYYGEGEFTEFLPGTAHKPDFNGQHPLANEITNDGSPIVYHSFIDSEMHGKVKSVIHNMTRNDYKDRPSLEAVIDTLKNIFVNDLRIPVIKGSRHVRTHKLQQEYCSIWSTQEPGILAIGGDKKCVITLIHKDGNILKYNKLDIKYTNQVNSGVHVTGSRYAITVMNPLNSKTFKLIIIDINTTSHTVSIIQNIDLIKPVKVFNISDAEFGVLSWGDIESVRHINVYDKTTYHHKSTTNIRYPDASTADSICPSPGGGWCVGSCRYHKVYVFSHDGVLLETLGRPADKPHMDKPGLLYYPKSVHVDVDGGIVVTCADGKVHRYSDKIWSILTTLKPVWGMFVTGSKIYTVYEDQFNVYNIEI